MAALGELLFYISTQSDHTKDNNPPESPSKDNKSTSGWQVSFRLYCHLCVCVPNCLKLNLSKFKFSIF